MWILTNPKRNRLQYSNSRGHESPMVYDGQTTQTENHQWDIGFKLYRTQTGPKRYVLITLPNICRAQILLNILLWQHSVGYSIFYTKEQYLINVRWSNISSILPECSVIRLGISNRRNFRHCINTWILNKFFRTNGVLMKKLKKKFIKLIEINENGNTTNL
jgi:hypothetical protein